VANKTDQKAITADAQPARQLTGADFAVDNPRRIGLLIFFLVFGVFGVWASVAPLDSAAHASGVVTVRSNKKLIQHLEGGIVSQILAQNGDMVAAGQPLLVLDNTQSLAQLEIANAQYAAYKALEARLLAERDGLEQVVYPQSLSAVGGDAQAEMAAQDQVFNARRASLQGAVTVLEQRIEQLQARVLGMRALLESKQELATSFTEELNDVRELLAEGFSDRNRLRELERRAATLRGEAAELSATISSTEMQIGETRLQILQQEKDFRNEVVNLLSETQTRLRDVNERMTALRDIVSRTVIAAPEAGIVNGLQVHTIGGVVTPGNPIAEIIPYADELIIESRISPNDIDRVAVD
jgi:membrane fusion protein, epimerase transport system